jgi:hypothetical protein
MRPSKRFAEVAAIALVIVLVAPAFAHAATIYVNSGVSGAKLGMKDTTAAKKLGKVKKGPVHDTEYGGIYWVRYFGARSHGKYALELYSNSKHKVVSFVINSSKYVTKKKIHVGSSVAALKKAYGSSLHKASDNYSLSGSSGQTVFNFSKGKITSIWVWRV